MRAAAIVTLAALAASAGAAEAAYRGNIFHGRYEPTDFQSAVSTQYSRPDGGRRYEYPPNTAKIIRPEDRTAYDKPPSDPATKSSTSIPASVTKPVDQRPAVSRPPPKPAAPVTPPPRGDLSNTDPSTKPPDQVGR